MKYFIIFSIFVTFFSWTTYSISNDDLVKIEKRVNELVDEKNYKKAMKAYRKLIKRFHKDELSHLIKNINMNVDYNYSEGFIKYNAGIAKIYISRYLDLTKDSSKSQQDKRYSKAQQYLKILIRLEYDEDEVEDYRDSIDDHYNKLESYQYSYYYYLLLGTTSFQDEFTVARDDESGASQILSTTFGPMLGFGVKKENKYFEFYKELSFVYGSSNVSKIRGPLTYSQSKIPTVGILGGLGVMNVSLMESLAFGVEATYLYRTASWEEASNRRIVDGSSYLRMGVQVKTRWKLTESLRLTLGIGKVIGNRSSLISFYTSYHF